MFDYLHVQIPALLTNGAFMTKTTPIIAFLCLLLALLAAPAFAGTFGAGLTLGERTPVSRILEDPDSFVGQKLQVEGLVIDVCARRGCWIYIAGDKPFEKIRVKVVDGEIIFPMSARGKEAVVEGVLEKFVLSKEQTIARARHHAEEKGEAFDPSCILTGETVYQLRGLGAEISGI